ncbi:hypothetical protein YC2023_051398 [Brassica napus]
MAQIEHVWFRPTTVSKFFLSLLSSLYCLRLRRHYVDATYIYTVTRSPPSSTSPPSSMSMTPTSPPLSM